MTRRSPPSRSAPRSIAALPPGAARSPGDARNEAASPGTLPALPITHFGAAPAMRPPAAIHRPPGVGGLHGLGVPPEIRRRTPGARRLIPEAVEVSERIVLTLTKAQQKLLDSRQKLRRTAAVLRVVIASRR